MRAVDKSLEIDVDHPRMVFQRDVPEEAKQEEEALEEGEEPEPAPTVQVAQPKIIKNLAEMINAL